MRAILLAAGMGTRLRPLTNDTPKALVKVSGQPMLERQIIFLKEKGIEDIIVLTGYLHEKFEYLKDKYSVKLIHNHKYDVYNNIYTMYLVKEYLSDSYVIEGDVFLNNNFIDSQIKRSSYFCARKRGFKDEWMIKFDENKKIHGIEVGSRDDEYILCGVSYWSREDGEFIAKKLQEAIEHRDFKNLYWDNIVKENLSNVNVFLREINSDDSYEIDSLEDLAAVEKELSQK
ncbi:CTP--phosphocholine cytidylyltransferase [Clostridium polynesiense]|uniref:CTP--phosphocholine cytidylyltransferase n=1 Tax=Clostridium polynesiense TaxID=1325933 RepID=UPI00058FFF30|nr:CTP--phosphocholine cytidylyltransferase [Clostridium polynesiense]